MGRAHAAAFMITSMRSFKYGTFFFFGGRGGGGGGGGGGGANTLR